MIEKAITEAQKIAIHCHSNYFYAVLFRFTETITATLNCLSMEKNTFQVHEKMIRTAYELAIQPQPQCHLSYL